MGSHNSKVENKDDELIEGSLPSTAISTPKTRAIDLDPRSPSANIVRTPIQMVQNLNQSPIIGVINTATEENIDPRSPALEFTRTPIVIETRFRNKNLDKVRQQLTDFNTPIKQNVEKSEQSEKIIGPKLLGVSPVIIRTEQSQKRNSYIGLLETDLDYIETNLDTLTEHHDIDHIEPITEEDKSEDIQPEIAEPVNNTLEEIGARALEIVAEIETGTEIETSVEETQLPEDISEINANCSITKNEAIISPIKLTLERILQIDKEIKEVIAHNPTVVFDDTSTTQEFDKKVTNLIYEDEDIKEKHPMCVKETTGNRTPLGDQNLNQRQRKSKHRVSEKLVKTNAYAISKIPVFKEKKGKSKMATQCENTPPRQKQNTKSRKSQWDSDNTLII